MTPSDFAVPIGLLILLTFLQALVPSIMKWNYASYDDGTKATGKDGMGPRDKMPETSIMVGRAERARDNLMEGLLMFLPALALALSGGGTSLTLMGIWLFLIARLLYVPSYLYGILYVRSGFWTASLFGIALVWWSALAA